MTDSHQLLTEYAQAGSEAAFRELVARYVDLVFSAASRLVNQDPQLAEDVTQIVFADLARMARSLSPKVMLGGWLHRHTCFVASKAMRAERRRRIREQQAVEMNATPDHSEAELAQVAPILDDAINALGAEDRAAILLRFFEQRDFNAVGQALGSTEEAARKRVNRALDKLQSLLKNRGVALSAAGLGAVLGAKAVMAAPAGLAVGIATTALAGTTGSTISTLTVLKIMSMTKLKIGVAIVAIAAAATVPFVIQHNNKARLQQENEALRQQAARAEQLAAENQKLADQLAQAKGPGPTPAPTNDNSREVLRLRGEVGKLRQEQATEASHRTNGPSALSSLTSSPEMQKAIRDQQKMGMGMIYKDFGKKANLTTEQTEKLNDLLADHVMSNIDQITSVLKDGKTPAEIDKAFTEQDAVLQEKVQALLGPEAYGQYQDYTRNLASYLTSEQFKPMLTGDDTAKDKTAKQLYQVMQEETQVALAKNGLNADFQTVPVLNFRNIASEDEADKNLKLLQDIYDQVTVRASSFLSADELKKFDDFKAKAISNNRMGLTMNRKLMAPGGK
jgi:RNA polymerase sigma factor (sigma-70 family)